MALREFVDSKGMSWRVWNVGPEQVHPRSKHEKLFLGYELGWLTFESADGVLRRRLCPCPERWEDFSPTQLEQLCAEADAVAPRATPADLPGAEPGRATAEDEEVARLSVWVRERDDEPPGSRRKSLRTFQFPGGRIWTVGVLAVPQGPRWTREVLRFASGLHAVDVERWPDDWERYSDAQLADLLRLGAPPRPPAQKDSVHRRRRDDARP